MISFTVYEKNNSIPCDINKEINNYEEFKKALIEYLNINPIINYMTFRKYATDLYYKINCSFQIKNYTFCNIYYT